LDTGESGAEHLNTWAGDQLACIDDLLFYPVLQENDIHETVVDQQRQVKKALLELIGNFVAYGSVFHDINVRKKFNLIP
jgi:acetylornithine/succinyldiaminopimelate/putrescine aminotransferase